VSEVSCHIGVAPRVVFAVLADGWSYSDWVVGTSHMRAVDASWPAVGAKLHHAVGVWPLVLRDESVVQQVVTDRMLMLTVKGRPLGEARVTIDLQAEDGGTSVKMVETPVAGPGRWLNNPLLQAVLTRRNVETLARLTALAERRTDPLE
jgi:hypothetical protein